MVGVVIEIKEIVKSLQVSSIPCSKHLLPHPSHASAPGIVVGTNEEMILWNDHKPAASCMTSSAPFWEGH